MLKIVVGYDEFMTLCGTCGIPSPIFSEETGWLNTGYTKIEHMTQ